MNFTMIFHFYLTELKKMKRLVANLHDKNMHENIHMRNFKQALDY